MKNVKADIDDSLHIKIDNKLFRKLKTILNYDDQHIHKIADSKFAETKGYIIPKNEISS